MFGNEEGIDKKIMDENVNNDNNLFTNFNQLRNLLREKQKNGLTSDEKALLNAELDKYLELKEQIYDLQESINFDIFFDSNEENEFSNLLIEKIISNFSIDNKNNNLDLVIKNFLILLKEINEGKYENNGIPIKKGDIENSQILGYGRNGEIKIGETELKFYINNKKGTITFYIESENIIKEYSFINNIGYENNKISEIQSNKKDINKKNKENNIEIKGTSVYDMITNGNYKPKHSFEYKKMNISTSIINGRTIINDNGLDFFIVKKGDTLSKIKNFLSKIDKYSYLNKSIHQGPRSKTKIRTFNIPANKIVDGMYLPIPLKYDKKTLSDLDFVYFLNQGLNELKKNKIYGFDINKLLGKITKKELIGLALSTAKQESGGKPIGDLALHRWEKSHKRFSFSYFHILMKGPGLRARKNLGLTEGEVLYPQNAMKLFLAFLIEKHKDINHDILKTFPIKNNWEAYASLYNGKNWKSINENYVIDSKKYYNEALDFLDGPILEKKNKEINIGSKYIINKESSALSIIAFQNAMKELGYFNKKQKANGVYGNITKRSVESFQKDLGIEETGIYDNNTISAVIKFQKEYLNITNPVFYGKLGTQTIKILKKHLSKTLK